jgi:hypothetical protein
MNLIRTKFPRIREIKACHSVLLNKYNYLSGISTDSKLALWPCSDLLNFDKDLEELKPAKTIKSKQRLTCLAINNMEEILKNNATKVSKKLLGKRKRDNNEESVSEEEEVYDKIDDSDDLSEGESGENELDE